MVSAGRGIFSGAGPRAAALSLALAALAGCGPEPADEPVIRPVRYEVVGTAGSVVRRYSGTTQAELAIELSFRVGGSLAERPVNVGDRVAEGGLIGTLLDDDYEAGLQEALARRGLAQAGATNARAEFERVSRLYENDSVPRRDYDAAEAAYDSARAQLDAASQQLEVARNQLAYTRLTAPQACTVARTFVEINQNVTPGQPIVQLNCGQCAEVSVSVPEIDIGQINVGDEARVRIGAIGNLEIPGFVQEVGIDTGAAGATYPVTIGLQQRCADVRAGMAAEVDFVLGRSAPEGAVLVPFVAVGQDRDSGDNFVFVLEPLDDALWRASKRSVVVGELTAAGLVVSEGLAAGERVVTAGVSRLAPGQTVRLLDQR